MDKLQRTILGIVGRTADAALLNNNANKASERIPVQRDMVAGEASKEIALNHMLPKEVRDAHINGDIHYHDLDYSPLFSMFNCFAGPTKFVTATEGLKSFTDYEPGDIVYVPSHTGKIRKAVVRSYGEQRLQAVTLSRGTGTRTIKVTKNHRWLLKDKKETTSLQIGDSLIRTPKLYTRTAQALSWCLGFGWGDGTMNDGYFKVRLFGNKNKYAEYFKMAGFNVTYPEYRNGEADVILHGYRKQLPTEGDGIDLYSFIKGYAAADMASNGRNIVAAGQDSIDFIKNNFDTAGFFVGASQDVTNKPTNYGSRTKQTEMLNITDPTSHYYWKVSDIKDLTEMETVWCLEVEEDHSFILQGGIVTGNCMLIDIPNMLTQGFCMGNAEIEPPKSISTACAIVAQIIAQVASHIYGGNTINNIDICLAPYVTASYNKHLEIGKKWAKSELHAQGYAVKMTEKECYDSFQALEYEINTLHTANGQTPFTTLGFGLGTTWESQLIQESILEVRRAGLGKHKRTAVFPKLVFAMKDGINRKPGDINYHLKQLALKCSSERMYPDVLNYERTVEVTGGFKYPMGCRSFLHYWEDENGKEIYDGRNNLGVVSVNIPRVAIEANYDEALFWEILGQRLVVAKAALDTRISRLRTVKAEVAPILFTEGACGIRLKPDELVFDKLFGNRRASISLGYIGLHEAVTAMCPSEDHTLVSEHKQALALEIVAFMKEATDRWTEETNIAFSVYSTPSESLCDRFCRLDTEKFGDIEGITSKGYYTNSFHLDVEKKTSAHRKLDFESGYAEYATGGHITYCELPDIKRFLNVLENVWDYAATKVPYFGTNTPVDYCGECGFAGETKATEKGFTCPCCGNYDSKTLQVIRRVCGYLGDPSARPFIRGKQFEVIGRIKHTAD